MNHPNTKLDQINIVSGNLDASIAFYRRLGVDIPEERIWRTTSGIHHVSAAESKEPAFNFDLDSMAFARLWNTGWQRRQDLGGRVVVGFKLSSRDAVDAVYADVIEAGYTGLQAPYDAFWGSRYAIVEDPDGIAVGLMSPRSAEHRSAPPDVYAMRRMWFCLARARFVNRRSNVFMLWTSPTSRPQVGGHRRRSSAPGRRFQIFTPKRGSFDPNADPAWYSFWGRRTD